MKTKLIIVFFMTCVLCVNTFATVELTIKPDNATNARRGKITATIKDIQPVEYDRLIFLSFYLHPRKIANDPLLTFNGWYVTPEKEKKQLWFGDILKAGLSDMELNVDLSDMMIDSQKGNDYYKLEICINSVEGLHDFLFPADKIVILPINRVIFNAGKKNELVDYSDNWEKTGNENILEYSSDSLRQAKELFVVYTHKDGSGDKMLLMVALSFIFCILTWLYYRKYDSFIVFLLGSFLLLFGSLCLIHLTIMRIKLETLTEIGLNLLPEFMAMVVAWLMSKRVNTKENE